MTGVCVCVCASRVGYRERFFGTETNLQRHQLSLSPLALVGAALQLITGGLFQGALKHRR